MFDLQLAKGKHDQGWVGGWVGVCVHAYACLGFVLFFSFKKMCNLAV